MQTVLDYIDLVLVLLGSLIALGHAVYTDYFVVPPRPMTGHQLDWYVLQYDWPIVAFGAVCVLVGLAISFIREPINKWKSIMPTTSETYLCDICNSEYPTRAQAEQCEEKGIPDTPDVEVGEKVSYERERKMGPRWAYEGAEGTIVSALILSPANADMHMWGLYVDEDDRAFQSVVVDSPEHDGWFRPYELSGLDYTGPNMLEEVKDHD